MIIYGYHIDTDKMKYEEYEPLYEDKRFQSYWQGCYTVGSKDLPDGVFGIKLKDCSCLFYPLELSTLIAEPSEEQKKRLEEKWKEVPQHLRNAAKNKEPKVFVFEHSDD